VSADQIFAIVIASIVTSAWVAARVRRGRLGQVMASERVLLREREAGRLGQGDTR